ncbi:hypothetical protein F0562_029909 [Nyssa sinensis]|uniref:IST1-like protein n=1 Tax=Nyssa sinensis TaxID=561372 RepID=A0A5J5AUQ4_9ASTE|nr:hypothetical protein F0562_029909 [Nyssa sinensis]
MLHRNFKASKCKTSLKMASSRLKLLKNKKDAQVKQLKRELAQLLESKQDQTARIRVEHVVREEKMKAAYDLIEIYCELIAARLSIIESQKNCPIDLKEAITSVIFASPRCADIPELLEVRKHFTAKYGKEFISAAVELRPDCGVSRMLVEKLSAIAPDGQTKIKILSAIAEEHNIKWDPNLFGEKDSKPPDDLLNGPNTFENTSKMHAEPSNIRAPNVEAPHEQKHNLSVNLFQQNSGSTLGTQNFASTDIAGTKAAMPTTSEVRPSGTGAEFMEESQPFSGDGNTFSSGRQNWNMEFKDATSAAQAAAESAERASMAARAAAELSIRGKISRQYSSESQKSNAHGRRDDGPGKYATSKMPGEHLTTDSGNNYDGNPNLQNEQKDGNGHDNVTGVAERFSHDGHGGPKRSSRSASLRSRKDSFNDDTVVNSLRKEDRYSKKSTSEEEALKSGDTLKQSSESKVEFVSGQQDRLKSENFDYFGKERIRKQSSNASSRSHSNSFGGNSNVLSSNSQKFGNGDGEDPFVGIDQGDIHTDGYSQKSSSEAEAVKSEDAFFAGMSMKKQSSESKVEFVSGRQDGLKSENLDFFGGERISKQFSNVSSRSHSSSFGGDYNVFSSTNQKFGNGDGKDPFLGIDQGNIHSDRYSQKSSSEEEAIKLEDDFFAETSMKNQSSEFKVELVSGRQDGSKAENFEYFGGERISKQSSNVSSRSHSSSFSGDYNVSSSNNQKFGNDIGENLIVGIDQGIIHSDIQTSSHDNAAIVFDESDSDDDGYKFDVGPKHDEQVSKLFFRSPGRKSPNHFSTNTDSWSPRQNTSVSLEKSTSRSHFSTERHSSPDISESLTNSVLPSKQDNIVSVTFDDSDSESEDEIKKSRHGRTMDSSILPGKKNTHAKNHGIQSESHGLTGSSFVEKVNLVSDRKPWLHSSPDDSASVNIGPKNNRETEFNSDFQKKASFGELPASQPFPVLGKSRLELNDVGSKSSFYSPVDEGNSQQSLQSSRLSTVHEVKDNVRALSRNTLKDDEFLNQASPEGGKEWSFGTLTGGLRNKGYIRPPYSKTTSGDAASSFKKAAEERSTAIEQSTASSTVESSITSGARMKVNTKSSSRAPIKHYDSGSDDSEEEIPQPTLSRKGEAYNQNARKEVDTKSGSRAPVTYFDSEEDLPKISSTIGDRSGSGFSRRTKASSLSSETNSYSKVRVGSEALVNSDSGVEREPSRSSYGTETKPKPQSQTVRSGKWGSSEQSTSMKLNSDSSVERESSRSSYGTETEPKPRSQIVRSGKWGSSEQSSSMKLAASKRIPESKFSLPEESSKSSVMEQPSNPLRKTVTSGTAEIPKTSTPSEAPSRENSGKKAMEREPSRSSYGTETEPKPRSQTVRSGKWGSSEQSSPMKLNSDSGVEREPSRSSYGTVTEPKPQSQTVRSGKWGTSEQSSSMKLPASRPRPESKFSLPKESSKSSVMEQPSNPLRNTVTPGSTESPKTSTPSAPPSRENSGKRASHVHPKLPDYDTIAAQLQALRMNRQ